MDRVNHKFLERFPTGKGEGYIILCHIHSDTDQLRPKAVETGYPLFEKARYEIVKVKFHNTMLHDGDGECWAEKGDVRGPFFVNVDDLDNTEEEARQRLNYRLDQRIKQVEAERTLLLQRIEHITTLKL